MNMKLYYEALNMDPFNVLPLTFHVKNGVHDADFMEFTDSFNEFAKSPSFKNVWIIKPGENTNRGTGIHVCNTIEEVI